MLFQKKDVYGIWAFLINKKTTAFWIVKSEQDHLITVVKDLIFLTY